MHLPLEHTEITRTSSGSLSFYALCKRSLSTTMHRPACFQFSASQKYDIPPLVPPQDTSIVDDDTPGATQADQLKDGASRLPEVPSGKHHGRTVSWLAAQAGEQTVEVAKLFAHIWLNTIDGLAGERHERSSYTDYFCTRHEPSHYQRPKLKCRCFLRAIASPRASIA